MSKKEKIIYNGEVSERIKKIRTMLNLTQKEFGEKLGVEWYKIKNIETKKTKLSFPLAKLISYEFKVNLEWILTGKGEMFLKDKPAEIKKEQPQIIQLSNLAPSEHITPEEKERLINHGIFPVPEVNTLLAAGGGSLINSNNILGYHYLPITYLKTTLYVNPEKVVFMKVIGDSMSSMIDDGDRVLVDLEETRLRDGLIFAISYEDAVYIKRIQFAPPRGIYLISENKKYPPIQVFDEDLNRLEIIGRCKLLIKQI